MNDPMTPISVDEPFQFCCSPGVPCFNACCRDLNQFLYPYDILRLKHHLGVSSTRFLERYATVHVGPESGLPIVSLTADYTDKFKCPFVSPEGCRVYRDRPAACRMYPLARALSRNRETGELTEHFALLKEPHCCGFDQDGSQTVEEWVEDQDLADYNRMNDRMLEIISIKNQRHPAVLDIKSQYLFRLALYDLDEFRDQVFEKGILADMKLDPDQFEAARTDDVALLELGMLFIKKELFGETE
ncbi:hypothetical protein D3OALGA1CA_3103 [Olavius algarvensis associated proteobacterium Delta 3]|nr:hypothetical protein D3OALGA1CA_3103 [Olavius algarvensis associated proteobacterium Delta 3]CAB5158648.1 hypothetical protein D3OALGB2SA_5283 [Olavius algarvensis associated proteobacterium Delta 3]